MGSKTVKKTKNWLQKLIRFKKVCFEANVCNGCFLKYLFLSENVYDFGPEPGLAAKAIGLGS